MTTDAKPPLASPLTARSRELLALVPVVRRAVQLTRLPEAHAREAEQRALAAMVPQLERLMALDGRSRAAYAFRVATNAAFRIRREQGLARVRMASPRPLEELPDLDALRPDHSLDVSQRRERMIRALETFDPVDRDIVALVAEEGLSEREAAERMKVSRGALAYRLRRARQALRRAWMGTTSWLGARPRG